MMSAVSSFPRGRFAGSQSPVADGGFPYLASRSTLTPNGQIDAQFLAFLLRAVTAPRRHRTPNSRNLGGGAFLFRKAQK